MGAKTARDAKGKFKSRHNLPDHSGKSALDVLTTDNSGTGLLTMAAQERQTANNSPKTPYNFQVFRDIFTKTCTIEAGLLNSLDVLEHLAIEIGEGVMTVSTQIALVVSVKALLLEMKGELNLITVFAINSIPDIPSCDFCGSETMDLTLCTDGKSSICRTCMES
jgi:hypothetical protein